MNFFNNTVNLGKTQPGDFDRKTAQPILHIQFDTMKIF